MNEIMWFFAGMIIGFVSLLIGIKTGVGLYYQIKEDMPDLQRPIEQENTFEETE